MRSPEDRLFDLWCRRGDAQALAELFDRTGPRLLRLGVHLAGDAAEAEDLVQATFVALIEQRASVDSDRPAWPWLTAVLAHKAKDARRLAGRALDRERVAERLAERAALDPSAPAERRELSGELARALDRLEEPYRQAAVLRVRHGMPVADIAHVLGRDPGTVRVQLHRALEKLRPLLPAALATGLALHLVPARGLAAVRAALLREATAAAAATATAVPLVEAVGAWIVNWKIVLACGGAAALLTVALWPREPAARGAASPADLVPETAALADTSGPRRPTLASPQQSERVAAADAPSPRSVDGVRGQVLDAATRRPIAGALVQLYAPRRAVLLDVQREHPGLYAVDPNGLVRPRTRADWPYVAGPSAPARVGREPLLTYDRVAAGATPLAEATSDGEGRFVLPAGPEGGLLVCAHEGYGRRVRAAHDAARDWTLALWRERELTGRVVTATGDAPGVSLTLAFTAVFTPPPPAAAAVAAEAVSAPGSPRRPIAPVMIPEASIEGLGAWTTECAPDGTFAVRVAAPQVLPSVLTPGWTTRAMMAAPVDAPIRVVVVPAPVLRFTDAATGAPIERVSLVGSERRDGYMRWSGRFDAPGGLLELPGSSWALEAWTSPTSFTAWAEGYREAHFQLSDLPAPGVHDVELERGAVAAIEGGVRRGTRAAKGAEVSLLGHSPLQWHADEDHLVDATRADAAGRYRLEAAPGRYVLRVDHEASRYFELVELPRSDALDIDLDRTGRIEVTLAGADGAPRAEHTIALQGADGRSLRRTSDGDGAAVFADLSPQAYTAMAPFVSTDGSFAADVVEELELHRGERREVQFELPSLDGPRHLRVSCPGVGSYEGWRARFGSQAWERLAPDGTVPQDLSTTPAYHMEVEAPDFRRWSLPIQRSARDGEVVDLDRGAGSVAGTLLDADGLPLKGWRVHAVPYDRREAELVVASCTTDAAGRFELAGLTPGVNNVDPRRAAGTAYDFGLGEWTFVPDAPAAEAPRLVLRLPLDLGEVTLRGVVLSATDRAPLRDHILVVQSELAAESGTFHPRAQDGGLVRTDREGRFELRAAATPRRTLLVYESWTVDGKVHEETFEDDGTAPIEILVE